MSMGVTKKLPVQVRFDKEDIQWMDELIKKKKFDSRAQIIRRGTRDFLKNFREEFLA